jgi:uncharacterized protein
MEHEILDSEIIELMVCPKCQSRIKYDEDSKILICLSCNLMYEITSGVPVMLADEAIKYK